MKRLAVLSGCGMWMVGSYVFPVQAQDYSGAGQLIGGGVECTGVAISPTVVLSAAHCYVNEDAGTLKVSPSSISFKGIAAETIDIAPGGFSYKAPPDEPELDNDLVAITLSSTLPTDVAFYSLYQGTVDPTQTEIVFVHNDGTTGNNVIDQLGIDGTTTFLFDYDGSTPRPNYSGGTAIPGEDVPVVSDSGGPSFILDSNNALQLLGINTFAGETTNNLQTFPVGQPGSVAGGILLSYYGNFLSPYLTPVPEPTSMAAGLLSGLLMLGIRSRYGHHRRAVPDAD